MKPCNAAALALVGWYLIVPSKQEKPPYWMGIGEMFVDQRDCEKAAARLRQDAYGQSAVDHSQSDQNALKQALTIWQIENAACSDDPRLKPK